MLNSNVKRDTTLNVRQKTLQLSGKSRGPGISQSNKWCFPFLPGNSSEPINILELHPYADRFWVYPSSTYKHNPKQKSREQLESKMEEKLIIAVANNPALYDQSLFSYRDLNRRAHAWREVAGSWGSWYEFMCCHVKSCHINSVTYYSSW